MFDELRLKNMEFTMAVTYLELYNEELIDLLSPEDDNSKMRYDFNLLKKSINSPKCTLPVSKSVLMLNQNYELWFLNYLLLINFCNELHKKILPVLILKRSFITRLFEDAANKGSVIVQGLTDVRVMDKKQVYDILNQGSKKRQTAATYMNATSRYNFNS